ncbi:MAG: hydantoinase B/oxoprolinase family protein, partial [Anaerolineales bacterium]|nr:hydantoinase B/oxoprolinase family protein [Anaerolineales bacterium]
GGSHLPDVTLVQPVFLKEDLIAFVSNIAHWSDVGGRSPGVGTAGDSTEIFQEGLRIPPTRIINKGHIRQDILDLLFINMRGLEERQGDFRAQVAALRLGEHRLLELAHKYGFKTLSDCIEELMNYSERRLRLALTEIPAGTYKFMDAMDDDGYQENQLPVKVTITVNTENEPSIEFDFSGSASQAKGGINMVWSALLATVFYAVKAIIAPDIPPNAGFQRPIHINAPPGCMLNAIEPAAVGGRTDTCQRVVDVIMGALSQAVPERVIAASNGATTAIIFGGTKSLSGKDFVYVEALGGGMGAHANLDGMDGVQVHITNTSNLPVEAMEMEYPLRVQQYKLVKDSGGAGTYRGGLSIRKDIQVLVPVLFSAHSDRHRIPPWGLAGAHPGECGRFILNPDTSVERKIRSKISGLIIREKEVISAQTAGGGGFGSPSERNPQLVAQDYLEGKISKKHAVEIYGVSLTPEGYIDWNTTHSLRKGLQVREE